MPLMKKRKRLHVTLNQAAYEQLIAISEQDGTAVARVATRLIMLALAHYRPSSFQQVADDLLEERGELWQELANT